MTDAVKGGTTQAAGGFPTRPFTIGLVGASNIAMTRMLPAFAALGIAVLGPYDNEPRRFRYWADSGVEGQTTNLDQLLASDIDAVYISTRNDQHLAEAVAAAEAGKHILVEKPMSLSVADAQTMIEAANRKGVVLAVNHHLPGSPLHATARRLVAEGRIVPYPGTSMEIHGETGAIVISDAMTQDTPGTVEHHTDAGVESIGVDTSEDLYQILIRAFIDASHGEGRPTVTGAEGLLALQVALAAEQSAEEGRTVQLSELH